MVKRIFSARVRELRKAAGLTQTQLAEALGFTRSNINVIENGERFTDPEKFMLLAKFFNVTADYLMGRTDNPRKTDLDESDPLARIA